jgi:hypothetical protein
MIVRTMFMAVQMAVAITAAAAPPANPDPALGPFYKSLTAPDTGFSCCSESDCRPVRTRVRDGREQVYIGIETYPGAPNTWIDIPDSKRLAPRENPVGEPVACWDIRYGLMCFVQGAGM